MPSEAAFFWDESFLWGLVSLRAFERLSLDFDLVSSEDIKKGGLSRYRALYVPGGWASNKLERLGEDGARAIRDFVRAGGGYIGICGGAGLATAEGLRILKIERKPSVERAPSISGLVRVDISTHPIWKGIKGKRPLFHIWWPSQFILADGSVETLASFAGATSETYSADLNARDVEEGRGWAAFEKDYGLNLDPRRMERDPLVVEGKYGKGRVLLSLIHFDTPGDRNGARAFRNVWEYYGLGLAETSIKRRAKNNRMFQELLRPLDELMRFGARNFLWYKDGWMTRWRRGIRGLEYFTLYEMVRELSRLADYDRQANALDRLAHGISRFAERARRLLILEQAALREGKRLTFAEPASGEIAELRAGLFGSAKRHGGQFKTLLDEVDALLYGYLKGGGLRRGDD